MDRYKAYLLPGVAALVVLTYYVWRWTANSDAVEPTPATPKTTEPKAVIEPSGSSPTAEPTTRAAEPTVTAPAPTLKPGDPLERSPAPTGEPNKE